MSRFHSLAAFLTLTALIALPSRAQTLAQQPNQGYTSPGFTPPAVTGYPQQSQINPAQQMPAQSVPFQSGTVSQYGTAAQSQQQAAPAQIPTTQVPTTTQAPLAWDSQKTQDLIITNTSTIEGYRIVTYKGIVEGVSVRQPTWGQNMAAGFQGMFGGSIDAYGQMCEQSRILAYQNLASRAKQMGANAVVNIRFDSESFSIDKSNFATAVVCYGTAVMIEPLH